MPYLLGIDIGTSGTKTLICDGEGKVLAVADAPHPEPTVGGPGWSEQEPRDWWRAACEASRAVLEKAGVGGDQIGAVGLSGQMHGGVFLGDMFDSNTGTKVPVPLRPAILWNDQRTAKQCAWIKQKAGGRKALIEMVGNPALTGFTAPKMLWVREHEPRVYERTRHVLLPKDYIRLCMSGEYATDVGDASGTLLLDVKHRAWNRKLMGLLEIDPALLPRCVESHEVTGTLTRQAAAAMGLKEGTPIVAGSGDQPAGAVGNGIVTAGVVSATLGTSGVVFAHSDEPTYDTGGIGGRVHTMCAAAAGKWCVFGCMLSAGGALQWYRNKIVSDPESKDMATKVAMPVSYQMLVEEARKAPPGCDGLFFLPYLTGERCPHPDPDARGGWIGLTVRHDQSAMIRALLEGVTFGMADALQIIEGMGVDVRTVRLSGGGSRSGFWRQLQADIYNKPTAMINSEEGPAYGAAILAGVGVGVWSSVPEACAAVIHEVERLEPDPQVARRYAAFHEQYQRLYAALKPEFARMAKLG